MWIQAIAIVLPRVQRHYDGTLKLDVYVEGLLTNILSARCLYWSIVFVYVCWDDVGRGRLGHL